MSSGVDARPKGMDLHLPRGFTKVIRLRFWDSLVLDVDGNVDVGASTARDLSNMSAWTANLVPFAGDGATLALTVAVTGSVVRVTFPSNAGGPDVTTWGLSALEAGASRVPILTGTVFYDLRPSSVAVPEAVTEIPVELVITETTVEILQIGGGSSSGGGGGTTVHGVLTGRSAADQHPTSAITGLDAALSANAAALTTHVAAADPHGQYALESTIGQPSGIAALDSGGQIPQAQLPSITISDFLGAVASQAAMLALTGQRGDWCTRTDLGTDFLLIGEPASTLGNWRAISTPSSPVSSVAGRTGAVVLAKADVGLGSVDNTADSAKPVSTLQAAADNLRQLLSEKNAANGYAGLDGSGLLLDSQIPSGIARDTETTAAVNAAVTALVNSSPAALDTLSELATALGNDPAFATTMATSLGQKVAKTLYDAQTILVATVDDTPAPLTVNQATLVGRLTGGNIASLTAAQVKSLLAIAAGDVSGLGTSAPLNVAATGDAASGEVVKGSDTRLTGARTPTAHQATHLPGGTDALPWTTIIARDVLANRPAAGAGNAGYLFTASDTNAVYESDGTVWNKIADIGGLPIFAGLTSFGHSYTQLGGNKSLLSNGDVFGNFTHRVAGLLNISSDEVALNGKSGGQLTTSSSASDGDQQGTGSIFRHVYPDHIYANVSGASLANSRSAPGLFMLCYGINDVGRLWTATATLGIATFTHALRSVISRIMAAQLYNHDHATVAYSGFGTTITDQTMSLGSWRKSTTNGDTATITLPEDFPGGTIAIGMVGGPNTQGYAATIASSSSGTTGFAVTLVDTWGTLFHTVLANGDVIKIDSEEMLITAGGGTTSITVTRGVNGTSAPAHGNLATVTQAADTGKVTLTGTAAGATGTVQLSGQGLSNGVGGLRTTIPVVKRLALTASDAGKTIILTVGGITTGSTEYVGLDAWWVEDPAPPPVLLINQPHGNYPSAPASFWTRGTGNTWNTLFGTVAAEFLAGNVAVVDIATPMDQLYYSTLQSAITTAPAAGTTTVVNFTPQLASANLLAKGSVIKVGSEQMLLVSDVTKTSGTLWTATCQRGYLGSTPATAVVSANVYDQAWLSVDRIHPSDRGHVHYTKAVMGALGALTQSTDQRANAGGLVLARNQTIRDLAYYSPPGLFTGKSIGGGSFPASTELCIPWEVPVNGLSLVELAFLVTAYTSGTAFTPRLGVRSDVNGIPGQLIADLGNATAVTAAGAKGITTFLPLKAGKVWLTFTFQGTGGTFNIAAVDGTGGGNQGYNVPVDAIPTGATPGTSSTVGWSQTGVTGALPVNFSTSIAPITVAARLWARVTAPIRG